MSRTIIKSTGLYLTDEEETELMEGAYTPEVGDIIQVTDAECESNFYSYGDIGRVESIDRHGSIWADFTLSKTYRLDSYEDKAVWCISPNLATKINVIKEGGN